jgi:hypothetical protein
MAQTSVFTLNTSHIDLADNLVSLLDEHGIYLPTIGDIKETVPALDNSPQPPKGGGTTVADYPRQEPSLLVIDGSPNPELVALIANKGL